MPVVRMRRFKEFIKLEAGGGIILFVAAMLALLVDNSPFSQYYTRFFMLDMTLSFGPLELSKPFLLWVNDGFMTLFFMLVGLEIKRELIEGELSSLKKAALPAIAAVGGMLFPAAVYTLLNYHDSVAMHGWAIPTATDIAFSLAILSLLGSRIPESLKVFLTALAIFDDIGAIIIIAIFYTQKISLLLLIVALCLIGVLALLNYLRVMKYGPYMVVGFVLWLCVLKSGVHATLAGIVIALSIPLRNEQDPAFSPLKKLEEALHPWVAYGVLPLFAFANAGVSFAGMKWNHLFGPITLGIALGLFIGKQLGITAATYFAVKTRIAQLPRHIRWKDIYAVSLVAGVGFTMSLFIGTLAFANLTGEFAAVVRLGVILGSAVSGLLGYLVLRFDYR